MSHPYLKELKDMIFYTWLSVFILSSMGLTWLYFGGKSGPWILICFALFQNIPMALIYMTRYKRAKEQLEEKTEWQPSQIETDDPIAAEVICKALNSGNIVIANVDEDGNVNYSEIGSKS